MTDHLREKLAAAGVDVSALDGMTAEAAREYAAVWDEDAEQMRAQAGRRRGLCPSCHGDGVVVRDHPRWGASNCPEPYQEADCATCGGRGYLEVAR